MCAFSLALAVGLSILAVLRAIEGNEVMFVVDTLAAIGDVFCFVYWWRYKAMSA